MPHRIAFVIFPDFQQLDIVGPMAAFEIAERLRPGSYAWRVCAPAGASIASSAGIAWPAERLPRLDRVETLVVSGGNGVDAAIGDETLRRWLRRAAAREGRIAAVCSGSMLLAAAGVLEGRRATTHWSRTRHFERAFAGVTLEPDRIYVRDGRFWTSAGITAGTDLALALIAHDHGDALARQVAQWLVVYYRRPGGQSQFSPLLDMERADGRFSPLLDEVRSRLSDRHGVPDLAARACMSPRHFARAFRAETGVTPARAVERLRVDAARAALESGSVSVLQAATRFGFGNAERMRRSFVRLLGTPPAAAKRRAGSPSH